MNDNILPFKPRREQDEPLSLRVITPDDGQRYREAKERALGQLGFRWVEPAGCYVAAPPEYDDERIARILREADQ